MDTMAVVANQARMKKEPPIVQMSQIIPTTPHTSNNDLRGLAVPHNYKKPKVSSSYKSGKLRRIMNLNMDVMYEVNDSDG